MVILTLNCGSSSAKYQVYDWDAKRILAVGLVERIGESESNFEHNVVGKAEHKETRPAQNHVVAVDRIIQLLLDPELGCLKDLSQIKAIGHRVVHGGEIFTKSTLVTPEVLSALEKVSPLAPLHNPANIQGIRAAIELLPTVPQAIVLDTAWHQTMPKHVYMYALPQEWYKNHNVRRYGFHGTSYVYTAKRAAVLLGKKPADTNLVIAHIGNGASICAVKNGMGYDTSMGMTPLEGLIMGTRSGDMDPAIVPYMMGRLDCDAKTIDTVLNKQSGLKGIAGYVDRRDILAHSEEDKNCQTAIDMEAYRIKKYIGAYVAAVGKVDAIVLTAGVGEFGVHIRKAALEGLEHLGIKLDVEKNELVTFRSAETCISTDDSPVKIFVIPTDEELVMTEDTVALVEGTYDVPAKFTYSFEDQAYKNPAREEKLVEDLKKNPERARVLAQKR